MTHLAYRESDAIGQRKARRTCRVEKTRLNTFEDRQRQGVIERRANDHKKKIESSSHGRKAVRGKYSGYQDIQEVAIFNGPKLVGAGNSLPRLTGEHLTKQKWGHTPRKVKKKKKNESSGFLHESRKWLVWIILFFFGWSWYTVPPCLALEKKSARACVSFFFAYSPGSNVFFFSCLLGG